MAIKILPPLLSADADRLVRFQREAEVLASLNHPNIAAIYGLEESGGITALVMELVEGEDLSQRIARGTIPIEDALRIAKQIADALDAAHKQGTVHRDLKPANIKVRADGTVKVLDFGLAKARDQGAGVRAVAGYASMTQTIPTPVMTQAGVILGTAAYMSPEQAQAQPLDERSDIFSFGAVMYELVSGQRPFSGNSIAEVLSSVLRDEPAQLNAPDAVRAVVTRSMAKRAGDRFASMLEVRAALDQIRLGATVPHAQPSIAVLPFANISGDKEQEYFSDGLAEEIINVLVKIPGLKVIARTSAFAFRGQNKDIRHIAEVLGVTHVLEGSVRRAGNRIRVTAQLIAAVDGSHLWSERYDRQMEDLFAMQDEIAGAISSELKLKFTLELTIGLLAGLSRSRGERIRRKPCWSNSRPVVRVPRRAHCLSSRKRRNRPRRGMDRKGSGRAASGLHFRSDSPLREAVLQIPRMAGSVEQDEPGSERPPRWDASRVAARATRRLKPSSINAPRSPWRTVARTGRL